MFKTANIVTTALVAVTIIGSTVVATSAQASTTISRSKITQIRAKTTYSISKGKTYKLVGSPKRFKLKANHQLKNYRGSTWTATKKTTINKQGKKSLYYYVKNAKNGAAGWVWHGYLKAGRDGQMNAAKAIKTTNMVRVKNGKLYQLKGNAKYVKFVQGKALSKTVTYRVTKQRKIYKQGKASLYYYVTGSNGAKGWTWHGYLGNKVSKNKATTSKVKKLYAGKSGPKSDIPGSTGGVALFEWN